MFSAIRNWIKDHQLAAFLIIAFGYTWTFQILLARFAPEKAHLMSNFRLAVYGPSLAALLVSILACGPRGLLDFLKERLDPRGNPLVYAVALFFIPVLLLSLRGIHALAFPDFSLEMPALKGQGLNILIGFLMALTFGPLAEELGWRGFALPELQKKMNPLLASLILGLIWWAWHLPSLLIPAYQWAVGAMPVLPYLALIMPGSVLGAWIYNQSHDSVLPAILFHGSMNFCMGLLGFSSPYFFPLLLGGLWGTAILVSIIWGPALRMNREGSPTPSPGLGVVEN